MLRRRRFMQAVAGGLAAASSVADVSGQDSPPATLAPPVDGDEDLLGYLIRTCGGWNQTRYQQLLGAANAFKEGDEIIGVAAADESSRQHARQLLSNTPLAVIDQHPPHRDRHFDYIQRFVQADSQQVWQSRTVGQLRHFLLTADEPAIHAMKDGLSSDVIACVVKLMSDQELTAVSAKLFNPLAGTQIGARGYFGARVQPNSPTDHPEDIRWQVLNAFAYGVGDVLLGTNPVSSDPEAVLGVQRTLQEVLEVFGLTDVLPHCVLSHIDIQAAVEADHPGSTALWFQSIAGSDAANATFDVTLDGLIAHARQRTGPYALYFETGQGADFTNGHGLGCDMVIHESRKYGLARGLMHEVAGVRGLADRSQAWVHVNDVAGFIGPEVFRSREQLVRCCLEDLVMGKLHGLTIGLDVCSTLHMDVSLHDLDWCLDRIAPAAPAYLMALPTKIDPMLGYLTTGYQDHVRLRNRWGYRINDPMQIFFQQLGVLDTDGAPGEHFGDPTWVYLQYCRRRGDARPTSEIVAEAGQQMAAVRGRGLFLAEGHGEQPSDLAPELARQIETIYADAKRSIWEEWDREFVAALPGAVPVQTRSSDRHDYILHPASGESLDELSLAIVDRLRASHPSGCDVQLVVSEGLNALALMDPGHLLPLIDNLRSGCQQHGWQVADEVLVITSGRVRAGYQIGQRLFGGLTGERTLLHIIGERPGSGHHTMSVYITRAPGAKWATGVDHDITRVVSGIATTALQPLQGGIEVMKILARS